MQFEATDSKRYTWHVTVGQQHFQEQSAQTRQPTSPELLLLMCFKMTTWEGSMMFSPSASHFFRRASSPLIESWSSNEARGEATDSACTLGPSAHGNSSLGAAHRGAGGLSSSLHWMVASHSAP